MLAACFGSATPALSQSQRLAALTGGADALPPIGWVQFCETAKGDCQVDSLAPRVMSLDERRWRELLRINKQINDVIEPISDQEHWGTIERWSYPTDGKGDCEDYVLEKRRHLLAAGWPRQALLVTVVRDHKGDGHAVLTVRTDRGDFVLDNQEPRVKIWHDTGYRFVKRQSEEHPNRWVSLGGMDGNLTTAKR